jgi:murein DD-endopeptidase MepM/ murein hydrolase activator NlpD
MINEPLMQELRAITDYLDSIDPQWRKKIAPTATGAAGSMTPIESVKTTGWITPISEQWGANIRTSPEILKDNIAYNLPSPQSRETEGSVTARNLLDGKDYVWHILKGTNPLYVRADVVTFSKEQPIAPIKAAIWPAPVTNYTVTNHHGDHGHRGIDYAAPMGTRVLCGPNGGHVVRIFECVDCNPNGDGANSYNDPKYGMGYGTHIVVRVENAHLPPAVKSVIPKDAFLFCLYAHLSSVSVRPSVMPLDAYQEIGRVGSTGNSSGPHLHFECCFSEYANASWGAIIGNQVNPSLLVKA